MFNYASVAIKLGSTIILPQCSQTNNFLFMRISNCFCGGILLKQPPQASRSTGTTANPFNVLDRTRLYAFNNLSSIVSDAFTEAINKSYPGFYEHLKMLGADVSLQTND